MVIYGMVRVSKWGYHTVSSYVQARTGKGDLVVWRL